MAVGVANPTHDRLTAVHGIINNLYNNNKTAIHVDTKNR